MKCSAFDLNHERAIRNDHNETFPREKLSIKPKSKMFFRRIAHGLRKTNHFVDFWNI